MSKKKAKTLISQNVLLGTLFVLGVVVFSMLFIPFFVMFLVFNPVYNVSDVTMSIRLWQIAFGFLYVGIFATYCWSLYCVAKILYCMIDDKKLRVDKRKAIALFVLALLVTLFMSSFLPRQVSFLSDPDGFLESEAMGPTHSLQYQNATSDEYKLYAMKIAIITVGGWFFGTLLYVLAGLFYLGRLKTK